MSKKNILFPLLIGIGASALLLKAFTAGSVRARNAPKRSSPKIAFETIDAYVKAQMKRLNIPGAALAIIAGDRIVHLRGFGAARPGGEVPSPQTPFFIGSLTKSFTALAIMQLVEAGKVALDAPVRQYLPWFRVADPQASAQMTVRHLLNQTSGLPALPGEMTLTNLDTRKDATEQQVRQLSKIKSAHPAGEVCEYSNLNYNILGLIIEAASGETFAGYIQSHIFDPLEMRHSYTTKDAARKNGLAMGHRHWFGRPYPAPDLPVPRGSLPSGQLIASAEDMAHYLVAHLNGGRYGSVQVLSEDGMAELHRGVKEYIAMGISSGKYGMGWFDVGVGGLKTFSHSGNVPDFSAHMAIIPEQDRGFILLFNADPYGLPPITNEVGTGVTALLAGQEASPIRLDFIRWIMCLLPLIPILQVVGVAFTLRQVRRWRARPSLHPSQKEMRRKYILLPLVPDLSLMGALAYLSSNGLIRFMDLFMPDLAWIARVSGIFAGAWACLRTGVLLLALRQKATVS